MRKNIVLRNPVTGKEITIDKCFINEIGDYTIVDVPPKLFDLDENGMYDHGFLSKDLPLAPSNVDYDRVCKRLDAIQEKVSGLTQSVAEVGDKFSELNTIFA